MKIICPRNLSIGVCKPFIQYFLWPNMHLTVDRHFCRFFALIQSQKFHLLVPRFYVEAVLQVNTLDSLTIQGRLHSSQSFDL